jgi:hypothetical protein
MDLGLDALDERVPRIQSSEIVSLERSDGAELGRPGTARLNAIDVQRRQRVQQRAQQRKRGTSPAQSR